MSDTFSNEIEIVLFITNPFFGDIAIDVSVDSSSWFMHFWTFLQNHSECHQCISESNIDHIMALIIVAPIPL